MLLTRALMAVAVPLALAPPLVACGPVPSCTVGIAGTDLTVTVEGRDASRRCDDFIKGAGQSGYRRDVDRDSTLMCRINKGGDTITVRDRGMLKVYGSDVCTKLQEG